MHVLYWLMKIFLALAGMTFLFFLTWYTLAEIEAWRLRRKHGFRTGGEKDDGGFTYRDE